MLEQVIEAMDALSLRRPCFHSEADFQFALAWQFQTLWPLANVRLEIPQIVGGRTYKLDLFLKTQNASTAIEIKYLKAPLSIELGLETFNLVDAVAHDINRYDCLKDVQRLEHILAAGLADYGFAIILTNQPKYWLPRLKGDRVDGAFGLEDTRNISGEMSWAPHTGGTSKGRELPIKLAGLYGLEWRDYSIIENQRFGHFRWLLVSVVPGEALVFGTDKKSSRQTTRRLRTWPDYEKFCDFLQVRQSNSFETSFQELEAIVGPLPNSARNHRAWWANHNGNPQATWIKAGWTVEQVELTREVVRFRKSGS